MITRSLKLKFNKNQEKKAEDYLISLASVYNWTISQLLNKDCRTWVDVCNKSVGHATRIGVNSKIFQQTIKQAAKAVEDYKSGNKGKPKFKSSRNKLKSFVIPKNFSIKGLNLKLPDFEKVKFFKQNIPEGKVKQVKIIKKASGWYANIIIDKDSTFKVKQTEEKVGIDTGFKDLAILSNGVKYENNRFFIKEQTRLAQAQRGKNKKLSARLNERIANRRKDYNHKVSRQIVENYSEIYITNDNLRGQAKIFGKSVMDAGISQLRDFVEYKAANNGRKFAKVNSKNTTKCCSSCWALTGPSGLQQLNVRVWECSVCRTVHDRDVSSACVILKLGLGYNLVNLKSLEKI